jgi:hypothetical protein
MQLMKNRKRGRRHLIYAPLLLIWVAGSVGKLISDFGAWNAVAILALFIVFFLAFFYVIMRDVGNWISRSNTHPSRRDARPGADDAQRGACADAGDVDPRTGSDRAFRTPDAGEADAHQVGRHSLRTSAALAGCDPGTDWTTQDGRRVKPDDQSGGVMAEMLPQPDRSINRFPDPPQTDAVHRIIA